MTNLRLKERWNSETKNDKENLKDKQRLTRQTPETNNHKDRPQRQGTTNRVNLRKTKTLRDKQQRPQTMETKNEDQQTSEKRQQCSETKNTKVRRQEGQRMRDNGLISKKSKDDTEYKIKPKQKPQTTELKQDVHVALCLPDACKHHQSMTR